VGGRACVCDPSFSWPSSLLPFLTASEEGEWMEASTMTPRLEARSRSEATTLSAMTLREGGRKGRRESEEGRRNARKGGEGP
jgi:hypothetical protein